MYRNAMGSLSNHTNNKLLNLIIILGKRYIYLNRFGKNLDTSNFKRNIFHIRLVESNMAINVSFDTNV